MYIDGHESKPASVRVCNNCSGEPKNFHIAVFLFFLCSSVNDMF